MRTPNSYFVQRRIVAKALGLCTTCRKSARRPSASKCDVCADRQRALMARRRAERAGVCTQCTLRPKVTDRFVCGKCLAYNRAWASRLRVKRVDASACPTCGRPVAHADIKTCVVCAERTSVNAMLRRAVRHG